MEVFQDKVKAFFLFQLCILIWHIPVMDGEKILGVENQDFDFDGLPGVMHEFKVYVPGNAEDCYYQPISKGARMHVNFEVLKGGDQKIDFYVRNPQGENVEVQSYTSSGVYSLEDAQGGTYAICVDNAFSRFGSKLVYIYIVMFVMHEWVAFQRELGEVNVIAANFSSSLSMVQQSVSEMRTSQARARFSVMKDWYLIQGNNSYVFYWSLVQCVVIVVSALVQVYSIRRLFRTTNVTPSHKPRA